MMEQRRALTIPFTVDKDNLMENPLRIPMTCLSSECGKLERQVSWTAFADCKFRRRKPPHKNGSTKFEPSHTAMITLEMARRKPLLILTDVLKTEFGKEYMERIRKSHSMNNKGQTPNRRRESSRCREEPPTYRDARSNQKEAGNNSSKSVTPKRNQRTTPQTTPQTSQRLSLRRRPPNADDKQDKEEGKDIEEVIISKDNTEDDKFAEVVDCGLSLSWEPVEDIASCDSSIKEKWTDSEKDVQPILKRKRKDSGSQCNGTGSPKRHRESVLRLTGENGGDGGAASAHVCHVDSREDGDLESLDRCIVQFTVGEDNETEVLVPDLEAGDFIGSPRQRLSFTQDNGNQISPSEPIVLSSDDEEGGDVSQGCSQVRTLVAVEDTVIKGQSSQEAEAKQEVTPDMQVLQLVVEDPTRSVTASPRLDVDYSCMEMAFSSLHCGVYHGKANGVIVIDENEISIPLKDTSEELEVKLTFECKELRRYSVWEQHELEERQLCFKGDEEPTPAAVLLFCVSETAAAAIQQDLCLLSAKKDGAANTGMTSPFILLTLREPLEGMEGALLRSLLDIVCLKTLANEQSNLSCSKDRFNGLGDILSPVLSLDDSIELIRRTGLDSFLLSMLGVKNTDTEPEEDKNPTAVEKESVSDTEVAPEPDTGTSSPKPKVDHEEQEIEHPSDKEKEEPTPVYTVCHRRTKGSYSVSLCKPDSNWTKYKHQGLARRLIQFPPPPLKGGITVTMEDLQCLDSGQYLNDVIIDFYLKYLLQNASAAVAERSHIFSSFFYKQLTRRDNASEGGNSDSCQRQRRHQRVKTWTRHVDIFKKDFLFVPVNQEAHWYLVVICFPGLDEPKLEDWTSPNSQAGKSNDGTGESESQDQAQGRESPNNDAERSPMCSDNMDTQTENAQEELAKDPPPNPVNCTELTCQKKTVCKRPCILIMDSLKLSLHERVFKLLREYLQSEWEVRRGSPRDFGPDQMKSSHCHVPLQDNSSDCGLYLLQYVECFLKDPVVHFDLPLYLERWFPRQQVWRKRDEIRDLILNLYRHQNPEPGTQNQLSC